MDFGRVEPQLISEIDFTLAPDTELTLDVLKKAGPVKMLDIYIGCAKWGRKEWVGLIYPEKTKDANFLDEYVKHFNSIELNAVFYNMPKKQQIITWRHCLTILMYLLRSVTLTGFLTLQQEKIFLRCFVS